MDYPHRTAMGIAPRVMLCVNGIRINATTTDIRFAELQQLCQEADSKASLAFGMSACCRCTYCTVGCARPRNWPPNT